MIALRLLLALLLTVSTARHGHTATVVLHATSDTPTALHLEVLSADGVTPLSTEIDHGVCGARGCNAVGTSATMTETVQIESTEAITLTGYISDASGGMQVQPIAIPASHLFYLPMVLR